MDITVKLPGLKSNPVDPCLDLAQCMRISDGSDLLQQIVIDPEVPLGSVQHGPSRNLPTGREVAFNPIDWERLVKTIEQEHDTRPNPLLTLYGIPVVEA